MQRLMATLKCDVRLQFRNGFYLATAIVAALYVAGIGQMAGLAIQVSWVLPAMVLNNLVITSFFFVAGLVLLERGEGSLAALAVTPLRAGEYLASKVISLAGLALAQNLAVATAAFGWGYGALTLAAGVTLAAAMYALVGVATVLRAPSLSEYLLPSGMYAALLMLPLLPYLAGWESWVLYLHPVQAPLLLMRAAFEPVAVWQIVYGLGYGALWVGLLGWLARRELQRALRGGS